MHEHAPERTRMLAQVTGSGIEIGAYLSPLPVPETARVRYADLFSLEDSRVFYPEAANDKAVRPDVIAPADDLPMLGDGSEDFVLCSHLMEHLADPIRALKEWWRVLRPGGLLLLILPDRRYTFDRMRGATTLEHLISDHEQGADDSARSDRDQDHYRGWARDVMGLSDPRHVDFLAELMREADYPVHFHCWTLASIQELVGWLATAASISFQARDSFESPEHGEFAVLLEKTAG